MKRATLAVAAAALAGLVGACADATEVELLEISGSGVLFGQAYLDLDGSGLPSAGDQPVRNVDVVLSASATGEVVLRATTDTTGAWTLLDVPVGSYRLRLDSAVVADSLEAVGSLDPLVVEPGDTSLVNVGVTFPTRTIEQLQTEPAGRRVFTTGIALNPRVDFDPTGRVHFSGATAFLRALNVARSGVATGDSVRLLGRIVSDNGRPALDQVTPAILISAAVLPMPREIDAAAAASAGAGTLDAALVRVRNVEITDTSTNLEGHFRFWAVDGADSVEVVLRDFLELNTAALRPDTIVRLSQATGLLTPVDEGGTVRWQLLPRGAADLVLQTKTADVGVSIALDTTQASLGDTVEVTVVASNGGPLTATDAGVRLTVPAALTLLSSTVTAGSFASGAWSVGDLAPGAADTLRISYEVTDGTPAIRNLTAESLGLVFEVDPAPGNNSASTTLGIS